MMQRNRQVAIDDPPPEPLASGIDHIAFVDEEIAPGTAIATRPLEHLTVFLTVAGSATTSVAGQAARHAAGAIVAIARGARFDEIIGDGAWWHVRYAMFGGPWARAVDAALHAHPSASAVYTDAPQAWRQRLTSLVHLGLRRPARWEWQATSLVAGLFSDLLLHPSPAAHAGLVDQVARLVDRDPTRPWRVPDLARAARMGVSAFAHRFRAASGEAPAAWVRRRRLRHAAELLAQGAAVGEVADRLGFCDPFHFSRAYKHEFGVAPSRHGRAAASPLH